MPQYSPPHSSIVHLTGVGNLVLYANMLLFSDNSCCFNVYCFLVLWLPFLLTCGIYYVSE